MNKLYCDFCECEISLTWDEGRVYKINIDSESIKTHLGSIARYDACCKCLDKLKQITLNKSFRIEFPSLAEKEQS